MEEEQTAAVGKLIPPPPAISQPPISPPPKAGGSLKSKRDQGREADGERKRIEEKNKTLIFTFKLEKKRGRE